LLDGLNSSQQQAVIATEGPLLILAGAGSGKTKTLTHRIANILEQDLALASQILAVTFTNKAAKEMRSRVAILLGSDPDNRSFMPYMGTFHGICVRLLRQTGDYVGVAKNFIIFDQSDALATIKKILKNLSIDEKIFSARTVNSIISNSKNELISPEGLAASASSPTEQVAAKVYPEYQKALREAGALDFDDLLLYAVKMLEVAEVRQKWQQQFRYIMIDEYQDTNSAQYRLVSLLVDDAQNIAVVGDDWQSIYSWRGANFKNILNFERDYPTTTVIKLEQNYRSTKNILDGAHSVIMKNDVRSDKKLWTALGDGEKIKIEQLANERVESDYVVRRCKVQVEMGLASYRDFAVLYRTNAQSRALEDSFIRSGVPYKIIGGLRFYDRKEVKDIIAYMRLLAQPNDRASFDRVINVPARAIGPKSLADFESWRFRANYSLAQALDNIEQCSELSPKAKLGFVDFANILNDFRQATAPEGDNYEEVALALFDQSDSSKNLVTSELLQKLIKRLDYEKYLDDGSLQAESRIENVRELVGVAKSYDNLGLLVFLEEISLISDLDSMDSNSNSVTLMTIHAAKGLEFETVYVVGMEENIFPHSRALYEPKEMEEERRLCYVAMTRAKRELFLLFATSRMIYGSTQHYSPSRFLKDIDPTKSYLKNDYLYQDHRSENKTIDYGWAAKLGEKVKPDLSVEPRYEADYEPGSIVNHPTFGQGTVLSVDGQTLSIYFNSKGVKKISANYLN
jgi:DNA helicase II / ATP-dependent DNA helicase PcrA